MKTTSFTKKYITKPLTIALAAGMIYSPFAAKDANAGSYVIAQKNKHETRMFQTPNMGARWFGISRFGFRDCLEFRDSGFVVMIC